MLLYSVKTVCDSKKTDIKNLVTKDNLKQSETFLVQKIKDVETSLRQEIQELDKRLSLEIRDVRVSIHKLEANIKTWFVGVLLGFSALILSGMGILIKIIGH